MNNKGSSLQSTSRPRPSLRPNLYLMYVLRSAQGYKPLFRLQRWRVFPMPCPTVRYHSPNPTGCVKENSVSLPFFSLPFFTKVFLMTIIGSPVAFQRACSLVWVALISGGRCPPLFGSVIAPTVWKGGSGAEFWTFRPIQKLGMSLIDLDKPIARVPPVWMMTHRLFSIS